MWACSGLAQTKHIHFSQVADLEQRERCDEELWRAGYRIVASRIEQMPSERRRDWKKFHRAVPSLSCKEARDEGLVFESDPREWEVDYGGGGG